MVIPGTEFLQKGYPRYGDKMLLQSPDYCRDYLICKEELKRARRKGKTSFKFLQHLTPSLNGETFNYFCLKTLE